jgi:hypothetical protein
MIRKRGKKYQAVVRKGDVSTSATFEGRAQAVAWATEIEARALATKRGQVPPGITFGNLLERYRDEVTPTHRGAKWETDNHWHASLDHTPEAIRRFCSGDVAVMVDGTRRTVVGSRDSWLLFTDGTWLTHEAAETAIAARVPADDGIPF